MMTNILFPILSNVFFGVLILALFLAVGLLLTEMQRKRKIFPNGSNKKKDLDRFMRAFAKTRKIIFYHTNIALPKNNTVEIPNYTERGEKVYVDIEMLFKLLSIPLEKLAEIYEINQESIFTGAFAKDGQQRFADIVGKRVCFHKWTALPYTEEIISRITIKPQLHTATR